MRRECGSCQLCCKLMPMQPESQERVQRLTGNMIEAGMAEPQDFFNMTPAFEKPAGERCQHQKHGKGCAIYAKRPFGCRIWSCRWLVAHNVEGLKRPDQGHYVVDLMPDTIQMDMQDGDGLQKYAVMQVWLDPKYPDAHRDPGLRAYIQREGQPAIIRYNAHDGFVLFPPITTTDNKWHEQTSNVRAVERRFDETGYDVTFER